MQTMFVGPKPVQPAQSLHQHQSVANPDQIGVHNGYLEHGGEKAEIIPSAQVIDQVYYYFLKRVLDVTLVTVALGLIWPLMLVIALAIKFDSPGPVIFSQERVGVRRRRVNGKYRWEQTRFTCHKFRSMKVNAEQDLHRKFVEAYIAGDQERMKAIQPDKGGAVKYKLNGDPRVTRVGKFLRKTSLDELPQLWNVLRGELSLVGPRPAIPYEVESYSSWHMRRLEAIQGMTGLWQVKGRGELGFNEMVELDIEYVETQSFVLDLKILVGTLPAVLLSKGAK